MPNMTALHRLGLLSCADDYTGLWEFLRDVQRAYPGADDRAVKDRTLGVIRDLLEAGYIVAGDLKDGIGVVPWPQPTDEVLQRIKSEWDALGREPNIWEIVWFTSTIEGERALAEGKERNELKDPEGQS